MGSFELDIKNMEDDWAIDSKIDLTNLNGISSRIGEFHQKYFKYINEAKKYKRIFESEKRRMIHWRTDYYLGNLPKLILDEKGWKPRQERAVLKTELDRYLDSDELIIDLNLSIGDCNDIIDFGESIIKSIQNMNFNVKNIIDEKKFSNGGY